MKKKLLAVVVAVSIVFCMLPVGMVLSAADAAGINVSAAGACGPAGPDNGPLSSVQWTYLDGKLTISGSGDMGNFTAETLPWADYVPDISSIEVEEGVTSIGTGAFRDLPAASLSVQLPSTVTAIYDDAFSGDRGLTSLTLPAGLTYVGNSAFAETGLTALALPDSVSFLGVSVFSNDTSLAAVSLPAGLTSLSDFLFSGCSALSAVRLPKGVTSIGTGAFSGSGLLAIDLPEAVSSVALNAFYTCPALTDIGLSSMTAVFAEDVFDGSHPVTLHGPEGSEAGAYARDHAALLLSYTTEPLPSIAYPDVAEDFVTAPAKGADSPADEAVSAEAAAAADAAASDDSTAAGSSASDAAIAQALAAADAASAVESHGAGTGADETASASASSAGNSIYAATGESITDMTGTGTLGTYLADTTNTGTDSGTTAATGNTGTIGASGNETGVTWTYDASAKSLAITGSGAMKNFALSTDVPWLSNRSTITTVTVGDGITTIGNKAFSSMTALASLTLPASLTSIGTDAFSSDTALTTVPFSTTTALTSIGDGAFSGTGLTEATLPATVTSLGDGAFWNCTALSSVTLPAGLTRIGSDEFRNDTALSAITIPDTVTSIGSAAFRNTGLTAVTLPANVAAVSDNAFADCSSLSAVTVVSKTTQFGYDVFPSTAVLTVESGSTAETYAKENSLKYKYASLPMTGISLNITAATMAPGATVTLSVLLLPEGASDYKSTAFASSDEKVAKIASDTDGTAVVTALAAGAATITATATNEAGKTFTAAAAITVENGAVSQLIKAATVTLGDQSPVVAGGDSKDANIAAAAKAISDRIKNGKLEIVSGDGLTSAITTAQTNVRSLSAVAAYLEKNPPAEGDKVTITVKPRFNIKVTAAASGSVTYDITPTYNVDITVGSKTGTDVVSGQALPVSGKVTLKLPLPDSMAETPALYITHKLSDGSFKYYKGTVADKTLTFDDPDGFSEFAVTAAKPDGYKEEGGTTVNKVKALIYRLFDRTRGSHLFTRNKAEHDALAALGWADEGTPLAGWNEADSELPIYRIYNRISGEHLLTNSSFEKDLRLSEGDWTDEGIAWYGAKTGDSPIYRLYKPNAYHMYTTSTIERNILLALGWNDEGTLCFQTN